MKNSIEVGQLLNHRYRVLNQIGEGGMGVVYKVEDCLLGRQVALKLISLDKMLDIEMLEFFKHEFLLLTELKHPNLAEVYDFGSHESDYFFTSEFIEGKDLFEFTENCDMDVLYDLVVQIARALEYIHSHGYIHNDIKPSNILVKSESGSPVQVKLIDFGIVACEDFVQEDSFMGSINFVAPEKVLGRPIDRRADLYSLGVTLYYLVTRELPFHGDSTIAILKKHLAGRFQSPRTKDKRIPKALEKIITKLIKKEIQERYQSAHQVIEDINRLAIKNFIPVSKEMRKSYVMGGKFIGRVEELNRLKDYLIFLKKKKAIRNGVVIAGESGTGKTRLLSEFKNFVQMERLHFIQEVCVGGKSEAYGPLIPILKQLMTFFPSDHTLLKKYRDSLQSITERKEENLTITEKEKDILHFHLFRFILEASLEYPFVLSLSDIHFVDSLTQEVLDRLLQALSDETQNYPLLLLLSYQTDADNKKTLSWIETHIMEGQMDLIPLHPLGSEEMSQLVSSMLGIRTIAPYFVWKVQEITRGNPFFVTELMKALIEENIVCYKGEVWQIAMEDFSKLKMPQSILKVFYRRIKKISKIAQKILHLVALYQTSIPASLLGSLLGVPEKELFEELTHLLKKQFLIREEGNRDYRYALSNERLRSLLSDQLSLTQVSEYHHCIAQELLRTFPEELYSHYEALAYHYSRSPDVDSAIDYCLKAGDKLKNQYANVEALKFYQQALDLLKRKEEHWTQSIREISQQLGQEAREFLYERIDRIALQKGLPPLSVTKKEMDLHPFLVRVLSLPGSDRKMETLKQMGQVNALLGKFDQAIDLYNSILTDDEIYLSPEEKAHILGKVGSLHSQKGDVHFALSCFERVENLLSRVGICRETAMSKANLAHTYLSKGDYDQAIQIAKHGLNILRDLPQSSLEDEQNFYAILGMGYFRKGDYSASLNCFQQNLELAQKGKNAFVKASSYMYLANVYHRQAQYQEAEDCYQKALELFKEIGATNHYAKVLLALGRLAFEQGILENALRYQRDGLEIGHELRDPMIIHSALNNLGQSLTLKGKNTEALEYLNKSLNYRENSGDQQGYSNSLFNMGSYYQHLADAGRALNYYQRCLELKEKLGDIYGESLTSLAIASTYLDLNLLDKAFKALEYPCSLMNHHDIPYVQALTHYISGLYYKKKQLFEPAKEALKKALTLYRHIQNPQGCLASRLSLAELYLDFHALVKAKRYLYDALTNGKEIHLLRYASQGYLLKGRILQFNSEKMDDAEEHLFRAIRHAENLGDPEMIWRGHFYLGSLYQERKHYSKSEACYQKSLDIVKQINLRLPEELKVDYLKDYEKKILREHILELDLHLDPS